MQNNCGWCFNCFLNSFSIFTDRKLCILYHPDKAQPEDRERTEFRFRKIQHGIWIYIPIFNMSLQLLYISGVVLCAILCVYSLRNLNGSSSPPSVRVHIGFWRFISISEFESWVLCRLGSSFLRECAVCMPKVVLFLMEMISILNFAFECFLLFLNLFGPQFFLNPACAKVGRYGLNSRPSYGVCSSLL